MKPDEIRRTIFSTLAARRGFMSAPGVDLIHSTFPAFVEARNEADAIIAALKAAGFAIVQDTVAPSIPPTPR